MMRNRRPTQQQTSDRASGEHPSLRRLAPGYKRKKRLVKNLWIISLLLMIPLSLGAKLALMLGTTFLGLMILDETL